MSSITHTVTATNVATTARAVGRVVTATVAVMAFACLGWISNSQVSARATPRQIADALVSDQNGQIVQILGQPYRYTIRRSKNCDTGPNPDGLAYYCEMVLVDELHNGAAASLQFPVYNKNINFGASNANLKAVVGCHCR